MMRERKGHRKLRLCSKKHYEKKKYFPKTLPVSIPRRTVCILKVSLPINLVSFRVSLPLSAYSDSPVKSVDILHNRMIHLRTVPQDWNCHMEDGVLSIYQLCISQNGPAVTLSLTIKQDFSWIVCYQKQLIVLQCSSLLQNIPSSINSVSSLANVIGALCAIKESQMNDTLSTIHDT